MPSVPELCAETATKNVGTRGDYEFAKSISKKVLSRLRGDDVREILEQAVAEAIDNEFMVSMFNMIGGPTRFLDAEELDHVTRVAIAAILDVLDPPADG